MPRAIQGVLMRDSRVSLVCASAAFLKTVGVILPLFVPWMSSGSILSVTWAKSGVMRGLSRDGEGLSTSNDWFKEGAGVRRLEAIHVTPAMKRGTLSWLRSMCSTPDWWLCSWLSRVWQRRRNPATTWSWCPFGLSPEALTGLQVSCPGLLPQWLDLRLPLLLTQAPASLPTEPQWSEDFVAPERASPQSPMPALSPDRPGLRGIRSAGPMGNEIWIFPVETGRGLRLCGRGLMLDCGLGRRAYRSGRLGERQTDCWGLGSYRVWCWIWVWGGPTGLWCRLNPNSTPVSPMGLQLLFFLSEAVSGGGVLVTVWTTFDPCWLCSLFTYSLDLLRRLSKLMSSSSSSSSLFSSLSTVTSSTAL